MSDELFQITGNDGRSSFSNEDIQEARSVFIIALVEDEAVGCGGLRQISHDICEIKRMYAKYRGQGIGKELLSALENRAREFGYKEIWLETRRINENAVNFYLQQEYQARENYGKYIGKDEAICFEKIIVAS